MSIRYLLGIGRRGLWIVTRLTVGGIAAANRRAGRRNPAGDPALGGDAVPPAAADGDRVRGRGLLHHPHARRDRARASTVINLETGYQFPETLELRERIKERYGIEVEYVRPELTRRRVRGGARRAAVRPPAGPVLPRPQDPAAAARGRADRRRWPGSAPSARTRPPTAASADVVQWDAKFNLVKVNPLLNWTKKDVWAFIVKHDVPYNPLHDRDYPSIGCWPCTRPVAAGEDDRAGRWAGQGQEGVRPARDRGPGRRRASSSSRFRVSGSKLKTDLVLSFEPRTSNLEPGTMLFSAKAEYACVAMLELAARHGDPQPVRLADIADKHGISAAVPGADSPPAQAGRAGRQHPRRGRRLPAGARPGRHHARPTSSHVIDPPEQPPAQGRQARTRPCTSATSARVWDRVVEAQQAVLKDTTLADLVAAEPGTAVRDLISSKCQVPSCSRDRRVLDLALAIPGLRTSTLGVTDARPDPPARRRCRAGQPHRARISRRRR